MSRGSPTAKPRPILAIEQAIGVAQRTPFDRHKSKRSNSGGRFNKRRVKSYTVAIASVSVCCTYRFAVLTALRADDRVCRLVADCITQRNDTVEINKPPRLSSVGTARQHICHFDGSRYAVKMTVLRRFWSVGFMPTKTGNIATALRRDRSGAENERNLLVNVRSRKVTPTVAENERAFLVLLSTQKYRKNGFCQKFSL